jgi:uncharacterized membrane-anchored protein YhcB (DUF1043 family)
MQRNYTQLITGLLIGLVLGFLIGRQIFTNNSVQPANSTATEAPQAPVQKKNK